MKIIKGRIKTFLEGRNNIRAATINEVRNSHGLLVNSYRELVEHIAELSFYNPEFVLFFRGQASDYAGENTGTSIYPTIFRGQNYDYFRVLRERFQKLKYAEEVLLIRYPQTFAGLKNLKVYEILRWAIIQHYDVCPTPLLDLTHSIRVACSFAYSNADAVDEVYIYVLGMPQISGSVTASSEQGIQIIRLLSICPPMAKRPYYQEGYLVGEFPTIGYVEKMEYEREEMDFGRRLICKFRLPNKESFWDEDFTQIPDHYLFPNDRDDLLEITNEVKRVINWNNQ